MLHLSKLQSWLHSNTATMRLWALPRAFLKTKSHHLVDLVTSCPMRLCLKDSKKTQVVSTLHLKVVCVQSTWGITGVTGYNSISCPQCLFHFFEHYVLNFVILVGWLVIRTKNCVIPIEVWNSSLWKIFALCWLVWFCSKISLRSDIPFPSSTVYSIFHKYFIYWHYSIWLTCLSSITFMLIINMLT